MLLLLVRHAIADDRDPSRWPDDRDRPLTDKGRKTQRRMSRLLGRLDYVPSLVLTSPWLRAAQTAQILVDALGLEQSPVPCDALATDPDARRLAECVGEQTADSIVAMVGHSPWMEELAALLLGGSVSSLPIAYPKSGVMGIDLERLEPGTGELRFFLRPELGKK